MALRGHSQTTSTEGNRITTYVNEQGDTMVTMYYEDARMLLEDVLNYEYTDSLLVEYKTRDSLNSAKINIQKNSLDTYAQKITNIDTMNANLEEIIENKNSEIKMKDMIIKKLKKEVRKQKTLKLIGFGAAIALPIIVLISK